MVYCEPLITDPNICNILVNVILPWIFSFAIIYGLVLRSKAFGDSADATNRGISGLMGAAGAFLIVLAVGPTIGAFLTSVSVTIVMYAAVILGIVMLFAIINPDLLREFTGTKGLIIIVSLILIGGLFGGLYSSMTAIQVTQDLIVLIITLLLFIGIVWFVTQGGNGGQGGGGGQQEGPSS